MENPTKPAGKNREIILLAVVAFIGISGLVVLQLARKTPATSADDRSMVQSAAQKQTPGEATSAPLQKIPGNLVTRDKEYPEAGQPFLFRMANFSQGAVYELDLGDGSPRKAFKEGVLKHTYARTGEYQVSLYARNEGQEVKLQTVTKKVVVPRQLEQVRISPLIDN